MSVSSSFLRGSALLVMAAGLAAVVTLRRHRRRQRRLAIGVDFGGTALKVAVVQTRDGKFLSRQVVPVAPSRGPGDVVEQIVDAAKGVLADIGGSWEEVEALGVSCPGRVEKDVVSTVANLEGWRDVPLGRLLRERLHVDRVGVSNDAKAALEGEMWSGAAAGSEDVVMITLGTGVGGAVSSNGTVLQGSTGMLGEVGHHIICVDGRLSESTGVRGIAEEYCSARALRRTWAEFSSLPIESAPDPREILERAERDPDSLAARVVSFTCNYIGVLVINVCRAYDPQYVVLGGGLSESDWFVEQCRLAALRHQWTLAPPTFELVKAVHGNWAGVVGAVAAVLRRPSHAEYPDGD